MQWRHNEETHNQNAEWFTMIIIGRTFNVIKNICVLYEVTFVK